MITGNRHLKKSLIIIALMLITATLLSSCVPNTDSYEYLFAAGRDEIEEPPIEIDTFIIVLPADASGSVYDAIVSLAQKIKENTLSDTKIMYDYEKIQLKANDMLILVGRTTFYESQSFLQDFRKEDFGYTCFDRTILICGACEESLLSAIERFRKNIVAYADSELFISNGTEYIFRAEYDIKKIDLNGYQLYNYSLVYPNGDTTAFAAASYFREILAENTGYYLDIRSDSQISKNARAICIGKTKLDTTVSDSIGKGASLITEYPNGISVISDNLYTTKHALNSLLDLLCTTDASSEANVQISSFTPNISKFDEITITDISPASLSSKDNLRDTANIIRDNSLDIIRICNISQNTANSLFYTLGSNYSMLSFGETSAELTHYIYDNSKHTLSYKKYDDSIEGELYIVICSSLSSNTSLSLFEIKDLISYPQKIATEINSIIERSELSHGTVFFEPSEQTALAIANALPSANRISENLYTFGEGTSLNAVNTKNAITNISLTLYR